MPIKCDDLKGLLDESLNRHGLNPVLTLAVALASKYEGMGRVGLSRYLSLRERQVRHIIDFLKKGNKNLSRTISNVIDMLSIQVIGVHGEKAIVMYKELGIDIIELVSKHVVYLRDFIVIFSANPSKVEAIGVVSENKVSYPGMPPDIEIHYVKPVEKAVFEGNGIVIWFNNYRRYLDDAVIIASISMLCSRSPR
ncbi:MAG: hypothetical protein QW249_01400 [Desulfurococcaceae archaeon]